MEVTEVMDNTITEMATIMEVMEVNMITEMVIFMEVMEVNMITEMVIFMEATEVTEEVMEIKIRNLSN